MARRNTAERHDAVVVGSGFAGAWAAKELTEAGFNTLLLEAGPARSAGDIPQRPSRNGKARSNSPALESLENHAIQSRHPAFFVHGSHLFVNDTQNPYQTTPGNPYHWIRGMQVGGRSLIWGGTALRLSPYELNAPQLDDYALSWPLRYEDLADAYEVVEKLMGLRGTIERLPQIPDSIYQSGSHDLTPAEKDFQEAYRQQGSHPIPVRFIPPDRADDGWPRFTMQATALAAADRTGRLRLRSNAFATEVTVDAEHGRATAVRYVDTRDDSSHEVEARLVFLCCGSIETARLMLNSRSPRYPNGIGNSSGRLGRGLMDHPAMWTRGVLDGSPQLSGYDPPSRQRGLFVPPRPGGRQDVRPFGMWITLQRLDTDGGSVGTIDVQGEMLPYEDNRVTLSDTKDRWGVPIPVINCRYGPHEERLYRAMRQEVGRAASVAGLRITAMTVSEPGENVHELGTARMGVNPHTSVLDPDNRCWDCPNVFVTDGSCFPSGGWQNPTLTIMALSVRGARRAAELLRKNVW